MSHRNTTSRKDQRQHRWLPALAVLMILVFLAIIWGRVMINLNHLRSNRAWTQITAADAALLNHGDVPDVGEHMNLTLTPDQYSYTLLINDATEADCQDALSKVTYFMQQERHWLSIHRQGEASNQWTHVDLSKPPPDVCRNAVALRIGADRALSDAAEATQ